MCPNCRAFVDSKERVCPYCDAVMGARSVEVRPGDLVGGFIPHARFTTMMILLLNTGLYAACVVASLAKSNGSGVMDIDPVVLVNFGGKFNRYMVMLGQWWRLVTAGFLHGGLFHILMNSWVLFDLGAQVEEVYGASRLLVFYFVATVGGFAASTYWSPALSVGASAGIFGLIGAMIALGLRHNSAMGSAIRGLYIRWAVYGLLFGLLPGFRVDNAAHIGGLGAGFVAAYLAGMPRYGSPHVERLWQVAAGACVLLTAYCFAQMFLWLDTANKMNLR